MGGIAPHSRRNWPNLAGLAGITFLFFLTISFLYDKQKSSPNETELSLSPFRRNRPPPRFNPERDGRKYGLSSSQCDAFFPGLFDEIHNAAVHRRAIGNVTRRELDIYSDHPFTLRAMIHSGNLYILEHKEILGSNWLEPRARAILHSIYRAVATSPEEIADAEFVMFFPDSVEYAVGTLGETGNDNITAKNSSFWSFSRREEHKNVWLMPDFGFWNWGKMGTLDSIKRKVSAVEQSMSFEDKTDRLLWRGRVWVAPETREPLMAATKTKEWADVVGLYGYEGFREKWVNPEDHCKWKYLLYAEGEPRTSSRISKQITDLSRCRSLRPPKVPPGLPFGHYLTSHLMADPDATSYATLRPRTELRRGLDKLLEPRRGHAAPP